MTNLIFSIVVTVATNSTTVDVPESDSGFILTSNPPQRQILPASRTVTTWCDRVTNLVEVVRDGKALLPTNTPPPLIFETGRARLWETVETFREAKTWVSASIITNWPQTWPGIVISNGMIPYTIRSPTNR